MKVFAKKYNDSVTSVDKKKIKLSLKKKKLLEEIRKVYKGTHESRWIDSEYTDDLSATVKDNLKQNFVPSTPRDWIVNNKKWLTNWDIENVIKQYEQQYSSFKFIGVHPIDFASKDRFGQECVSPTICSLNVTNLIRNEKSKLAFVFNLDRHDQSGSHWVTLLCNLSPTNYNFGCFFIDSTGAQVPTQIWSLMKNIEKQVLDYFTKRKIRTKKFTLFQNRKEYQKENTECGMFAIYFITKFITTKMSIKNILSKNVTDNDVFRLRRLMYNPYRIEQ